MRRARLLSLLLAAVLLTGCAMRTPDQLYRLPRRSEKDNNLQSAIDSAMAGVKYRAEGTNELGETEGESVEPLEYCAPRAGENQQTVQRKDLDGDGVEEALLFARTAYSKQLMILVFSMVDQSYCLRAVVTSPGTEFERVDYVSMDQDPGWELVVGYRISDQVSRTVTVYGFRQGKDEPVNLMSANYMKYLTCDLNQDGRQELFVLHPGATYEDNGVAVWCHYEDGQFDTSQEVSLSEPEEHVKRFLTGKLYGEVPGVYIASSVDENAILTDVIALVNGKLTNVTLSNFSGTGIQTMRNYDVYSDDIDDDGVMELPSLLYTDQELRGRQSKIRWYAMTLSGQEVDKMYTYHNFEQGWYLKLDPDWMAKTSVETLEDGRVVFEFKEHPNGARRHMMTVFVLSGDNRQEESEKDGRIRVYETDTQVFSVSLGPIAEELGITADNVKDRFRLIYEDWKNGKT